MNGESFQLYRVFISSPGDVAPERKIAEEVLSNVNRVARNSLGLGVEASKWEHMPPISPHLPEEKLQDVINKEVGRAHFFVLILNRRYGRTEPGHGVSNTEREVDAILERFKTKPQIRILVYFKELEDNPDQGDQEKLVRDFRHRLEGIGLPYRLFRSAEEFRDAFTHDLYDVTLRMRLSPFKQQALRSFWMVGDSDRPHLPQLAIVWPPVDRSGMAGTRVESFWLERLSANMRFEDHKCLRKIEKDLQLIGIRNYRVYPHTDLPAEIEYMNRVWLCVPRNPPALRALRGLGRFSFLPVQSKKPARLVWKAAPHGEIEIESPLSTYLRIQRRRMPTKGDWRPEMGHVFAKDYAVLARLKRPATTNDGEPMWDYVLAGVRGLGTWGAAWYVDRHYASFQRLESEDVQLLLEISFLNNRIIEAKDVSDQPPSYFAQQVKVSHIRDEIKEAANRA